MRAIGETFASSRARTTTGKVQARLAAAHRACRRVRRAAQLDRPPWRKAQFLRPASSPGDRDLTGAFSLIADPLEGALVQDRNLRGPPSAVSVLKAGDLTSRPVEVVSDESYLLIELVEGVAANPPRLSTSTVN